MVLLGFSLGLVGCSSDTWIQGECVTELGTDQVRMHVVHLFHNWEGFQEAVVELLQGASGSDVLCI